MGKKILSEMLILVFISVPKLYLDSSKLSYDSLTFNHHCSLVIKKNLIKNIKTCFRTNFMDNSTGVVKGILRNNCS